MKAPRSTEGAISTPLALLRRSRTGGPTCSSAAKLSIVSLACSTSLSAVCLSSAPAAAGARATRKQTRRPRARCPAFHVVVAVVAFVMAPSFPGGAPRPAGRPSKPSRRDARAEDRERVILVGHRDGELPGVGDGRC